MSVFCQTITLRNFTSVFRAVRSGHIPLKVCPFVSEKAKKKIAWCCYFTLTFLSTDVNLRVVSSSLRVVIGSEISSGTPRLLSSSQIYIYPCYLLLYNHRPRSRPRQLFCFHSEQKHGDKENRGILEAGEVGRK